MKAWLDSILQRIAEGSLLPPASFAELDCDEALDARNEEAFERRWVQLSGEIDRRWETANISEELQSLAEDVRRESFLAVSRATAQHEIASYVSDDFELIVRGRPLGMNDPLLDQFWHAYEKGIFPRPMN